MIIIENIEDIEQLKTTMDISTDFIRHLQTHFMVDRGTQKIIGILEAEDTSLAALGLPETLEEIMPEWVSVLPTPEELHGVFYFLGEEGMMRLVYVASPLWAEVFQKWLLAQPIENIYEQ